jgi:hypothetical protein
VARPFLFLMSDHGKPADEIGRRIFANIRSIRARSKKPCPEWALRGTRHFNFSDQCLMKDRLLTRIVGGAGPIDARRGLATASECVRTFFDVHLKGAPAARFEGLPSRFPEIAVEPGLSPRVGVHRRGRPEAEALRKRSVGSGLGHLCERQGRG